MIDAIIDALRSYESPNVFNPWRDKDPLDIRIDAPDWRCRQLRSHFDVHPRFLLIGEAPGYQGCHFSGVPFTNEALICGGYIPRIGDHGRITSRKLPWREPSATIVWKALRELRIDTCTVMWNAFAFHPHKPGEQMSNRAPTRVELGAGRHILKMVVDHFEKKGAKTVAVGEVAYKALTGMAVVCTAKLRHPSMGGASAFRSGLANLCDRPTVSA